LIILKFEDSQGNVELFPRWPAEAARRKGGEADVEEVYAEREELVGFGPPGRRTRRIGNI
jgi:hypothetical protein